LVLPLGALSFWQAGNCKILCERSAVNHVTLLTETAHVTFFLRSRGLALLVPAFLVVRSWPIAFFILRIGGRYRTILSLLLAAEPDGRGERVSSGLRPDAVGLARQGSSAGRMARLMACRWRVPFGTRALGAAMGGVLVAFLAAGLGLLARAVTLRRSGFAGMGHVMESLSKWAMAARVILTFGFRSMPVMHILFAALCSQPNFPEPPDLRFDTDVRLASNSVYGGAFVNSLIDLVVIVAIMVLGAGANFARQDGPSGLDQA
jgi:hypothetical protein